MSTQEPLDFLDLLKEHDLSGQDCKNGAKSESSPIKIIVQDKVGTVSKLLDKNTAKLRQEAASRPPKQEFEGASSAFVPMVDPNTVLEYSKPGIQPYVMRKLRTGEYREADFIDLHGKTLEQAYDYVMEFLNYAIEKEYRCILIIHGKGERAVKEKALIKSYVAHWLKQIPEVLAFHSAPQWKGGTGSVFVILKKGDKAKAINRENHAKR